MTPDLKRLCEAAASAGNSLPIDYEGGYSASDDPDDWEAIVRAVLMAMREPSEAAEDTAWDRFNWLGPDYADSDTEATPKGVFTAMIDHILAEPATA